MTKSIELQKLIEEQVKKTGYIDGEIVAFVHAKGTSSRVPSKNMRQLGDMPLFCHAIKNAKASKKINTVVIDSDSDEILILGEQYGAVPLKRPVELATNMATGDDLAYWQASNAPTSKIVLQVIPTAPFLSGESIDRAIEMLECDSNLDSVVGVYEDALYLWENGSPSYFKEDGSIPNSVDLKKCVYETTGLYVNHTAAVLRIKKRLNPNNCKPCVLSKIETVDINTMEDFEFAEVVWRGLNSNQQRR